jgi:hypothetical protein
VKHRGDTTGPIRVDDLMRRLRLERVNAQRARIGLPARPAAPVGPPVTYEPIAWRHLVSVVLGCVAVFVATFLVALWLEQVPPGYARPAAPRSSTVTTPALPPSATP